MHARRCDWTGAVLHVKAERVPIREKVGKAASPLCWPQWIQPLGLVACLDSRDMAAHEGTRGRMGRLVLTLVERGWSDGRRPLLLEWGP